MEMEKKIKIGLVYGSTRPGRFCDTVARWAAAQIARSGRFEVQTLDPAGSAGVQGADDGLAEGIAGADAFVVVTPEYNHGYPAALKSLIDSVGEEWQAKPVAFVSYGGVSGGLRAVEHLRQVFAELHATTVRDTVSFHNAGASFDDEGQLRDPSGPDAAAKTMLDQVVWWGRTLREGRAVRAY